MTIFEGNGVCDYKTGLILFTGNKFLNIFLPVFSKKKIISHEKKVENKLKINFWKIRFYFTHVQNML